MTKRTKKKHIKKQSSSVNPLLHHAEEAIAQFRYSDAVKILQQILKNDPNNTTVLDLLGESYLGLSKPEQAKQCFLSSVKLKPNIGHSKYMYLGQILEGKQSLQNFQKGLQILLDLKKCGGSFPGGMQALKKAIAEGYCSIAELYMTDLCDEDDAEQNCEQALQCAIKEDGENIQVFQTLASLRMSQNRPQDAKKAMEKVMNIYRSGIKISSQLNERKGKVSPPYDFRMSTAKLLMEVGEHKISQQVLENLAEEYDQVTDVFYLLGVCHHFQKNYDSAIEHLTRALDMAKALGEDPALIDEIQQQLQICKKEQPKSQKQQTEEEDSDDIDALISDDSDDDDDDEMQDS